MKNKLLILIFTGSLSLAFGQTTLSVAINASLDDHEEHIVGTVPNVLPVGSMDPASSDLELGNEKAAADPQLVGLRFTSLTIPANAMILNAYIQFKVDDIGKNTDPCELTVQVEDNVNPATFSDNAFSLSSRTLMGAMVGWTVTGASWGTIGSMGPDQRTPDLKSLLQALVNKPNWASGNSMAFYIKGKGTREVESFDGGDPNPPMLVVQYTTTATGMDEIKNRSSVNVYPNPFSGSFNIAVDNNSDASLKISIYNVTGSLVEETTATNIGGNTFHYASSANMAPGLYFVKVNVNDKQHLVKLIAE